jgi:hypothetical protein
MTGDKSDATRPVWTFDRFVRDESGVATIFACFIIMMMVLVGGIGVDLMHNEMERTKLQNTLDRSVLAAANLEQQLDPESVVRDYFAKSNQTRYLKSVTVVNNTFDREVTATAHKEVPTQFMRLMGVPELGAPGRSRAEERFPNVELSLVIDISRTMNVGDKMSQMRTAGISFTQAVLRADTSDRVSLNVVPFSEQVALTSGMYNVLNVFHRHDYSYCVDIPRDTYGTTELDVTQIFQQSQHFQWLDPQANNINSNPTCPNKNHQHIRPLEQDSGELIRGFNGLSGSGSRSIYRGMKWGVALLDPSTRPLVSDLVAAGEVDPAFDGRPSDYGDINTLKAVVLMSGGVNEPSLRIKDDRYDSSSEYVHWRKNNLMNWLDNYVPPEDHANYYETVETEASGDILLDQICDAAKDQGIVIFTVAFEADDISAANLQQCASSPSHYFRVYGDDLEDVLFRIGTQLTRLRLTN